MSPGLKVLQAAAGRAPSDNGRRYRPAAAGYRPGMDREADPTRPEELVGKDELDEDDEMELSGDDLVDPPVSGTDGRPG